MSVAIGLTPGAYAKTRAAGMGEVSMYRAVPDSARLPHCYIPPVNARCQSQRTMPSTGGCSTLWRH